MLGAYIDKRKDRSCNSSCAVLHRTESIEADSFISRTFIIGSISEILSPREEAFPFERY
jgi:hypothetical protein